MAFCVMQPICNLFAPWNDLKCLLHSTPCHICSFCKLSWLILANALLSRTNFDKDGKTKRPTREEPTEPVTVPSMNVNTSCVAHSLLRYIWKRRDVVLELQWFVSNETFGLAYLPPPWMPPPCWLSTKYGPKSTPPRNMPPPSACRAKYLGLWG